MPLRAPSRLPALTVAALALVLPERAPAAVSPVSFPLAIAVASAEDGGLVVPQEWVDGRVDAANRLFSAAHVHFEPRTRPPLPASFARVATREDRDRFADRADPAAINVFIVASLKDVDEDDRYRRGVHWRLRADPSRRFILLSSIAEVTVLAHELGHYFGNGHSSTVNDVMSYQRDGGPVFFDPVEVARIRASAAVLARLLPGIGASPPLRSP